MPFIAEGQFAIRSGPVMASSDYFEIVVRGRGSHGAWPHDGIDVIGIASEIVLALNHIVARSVDPLESAVISATQFNAGHASNVMPELARVIGTARAFSSTTQDHLEARMRQVCLGIAAAYGATADVTYERRYPPTINHVRETEVAVRAASRVTGAERVLLDEPPVMAAEDFAWMLLEKPGCYVWIGNGPQHQGGCGLHNPSYDFNDRILPVGASYWVELTEDVLAESAATR
jgi:amidohydrolase